MKFLPISINLTNKKILIIGGSNIANQKLNNILPFTKNITIISPTIIKELKKTINKYSLKYIKREYEKSDIKNYDIIINATSNLKLQKNIYIQSRNHKCLYNCVDIKEYCDFILNSYIKKDKLTISINTNGNSPSIAKELKIYIDKLLPKSLENFFIKMKNYRKKYPKGIKRQEKIRKK